MSYQHPILGEALGWKYNHVPGICTRGGELTSWPIVELGVAPDDTAQALAVSQYEAFLAAAQSREAGIDTAITNDATIQQLKAMTNTEFDTWWDANVTNAAQAIAVLKRLTRVIIRRVL